MSEAVPEVVGVERVSANEVSNHDEAVGHDNSSLTATLLLYNIKKTLKGAGESQNFANFRIRFAQFAEEEKPFVPDDF